MGLGPDGGGRASMSTPTEDALATDDPAAGEALGPDGGGAGGGDASDAMAAKAALEAAVSAATVEPTVLDPHANGIAETAAGATPAAPATTTADSGGAPRAHYGLLLVIQLLCTTPADSPCIAVSPIAMADICFGDVSLQGLPHRCS
jgi:hypothetical protein